jgi:hypothetical protein
MRRSSNKTVRVSLRNLRWLIHETLGAGASGSDPRDPKGFYPYEKERGNDIHGFWYKSPGRPVGQDGDPFRPEDAAAYIGQKPPPNNTVDTPGEEAEEDQKGQPVIGQGSPGEEDVEGRKPGGEASYGEKGSTGGKSGTTGTTGTQGYGSSASSASTGEGGSEEGSPEEE